MAGVMTMTPMGQQAMFEEPCRLLQLPDEVKLEIVKHVHRRRDLYNFSLACKSLEDMTLSRLYESIDVEIPGSSTPYWNQDALPTFRPYVLQNMRELAIRNGMSDVKNPVYNKRRRSDANTTEGYVGEIFKSVPKDRLKGFSFLHKTPVSMHMLDGLTRQHGHSLRHFQCSELELLSNSEVTLPSNLHTLECRSVLSGEAITKLIANNKDTLKSLTLGQDKYLLQQYRERRIGFLNNIPQPSPIFQNTLDLSTLPDLRSLSLSGLNLSPLLPQSMESALALTRLESLTIESCPATAEFLDILSSTFTHLKTLPNPPQTCLKTFSLRHELPTAPFQASLIRFLTSFTGLNSLSILLENATLTHRPSTFLASHTSTLQTLTLETRIQPRDHGHIDTSRPIGPTSAEATQWLTTFQDIATSSPHLSELGTAFPWHLDAATQLACAAELSKLTHLKTLHARNFPASATAATVHTHASQLLSTLAATAKSTASSLETLAVGPTLYATRWRLEPPSSTSASARPTNVITNTTTPTATANDFLTVPSEMPRAQPKAADAKKKTTPPEHLCTHYFAVRDGAQGGCEAVSERVVEEARGQRRGLGGVFEGVWLR